jgi:hypothetical protein
MNALFLQTEDHAALKNADAVLFDPQVAIALISCSVYGQYSCCLAWPSHELVDGICDAGWILGRERLQL